MSSHENYGERYKIGNPCHYTETARKELLINHEMAPIQSAACGKTTFANTLDQNFPFSTYQSKKSMQKRMKRDVYDSPNVFSMWWDPDDSACLWEKQPRKNQGENFGVESYK